MAKDAGSDSVGTLSMQAHAEWLPQAETCVITGTDAFRWGILTNLFVDLSLLCIMFIGVVRKKNATHLWRILYFQSIFWILTAISTEVPCVVRRRCLDFDSYFFRSHAWSDSLKVLPFMNMNGMWKLMTRP
jgi:hypothetical protein